MFLMIKVLRNLFIERVLSRVHTGIPGLIPSETFMILFLFCMIMCVRIMT
jgi:hypothetical protein